MSNVAEIVFTSDTADSQWNTCVWDPRAGTTLMTYKNGSAAPHTLCLLGNDYLLSAEPGKPLIRSWALNKKEQSQQKIICPGIVSALATSPDGSYIVAGISEVIHVWQTSTGYMLASIKAHFQNITCLKFTDNCQYLISSSEDSQVQVWDFIQLVRRYGLGDMTIRNEATAKYSFNHHTLPVNDIFIGKGGVNSLMATVSLDQTCKIYDLSTGNLLLSLIFSIGLTSVTINSINSEIFIGTACGKIYTYYLKNAPRIPEYHIPEEYSFIFNGHDKVVSCLSASMDSTLLLSGSHDEKVIIWDIFSRQMLRTLQHKAPITNAFFTISPKNIFNDDLKASIVLKPLLRTAGTDQGKEIEIIQNGTCSKSLSKYNLNQLDSVLNQLSKGEIPSIYGVNKATDTVDQVQSLKSINHNLYKFAVDELLKPVKTISNNNNVTPTRNGLSLESPAGPSSTPKSAKKRKR